LDADPVRREVDTIGRLISSAMKGGTARLEALRCLHLSETQGAHVFASANI